jgi:hypothetical protein
MERDLTLNQSRLAAGGEGEMIPQGELKGNRNHQSRV